MGGRLQNRCSKGRLGPKGRRTGAQPNAPSKLPTNFALAAVWLKDRRQTRGQEASAWRCSALEGVGGGLARAEDRELGVARQTQAGVGYGVP